MPALIPIHQAIAALSAWPHLSREVINNVIFGAAILLEAELIFVTFRRGIARSFPGFTVLMIFYPLRAGLLFALTGRIDADALDPLVNALGLAEMLLQAWVLVEIVRRLIGEMGGWTRRRSMVLLLLLGAACGLAWAVLHALSRGGFTDRVQIYVAFLMLALFVLALKAARWRNLLCIVAGFAGFAAIQLVSLASKAYAIKKHHLGAYIGWSYVPAIGYLAVVVFWLIGLKRQAAE
jgi:hypothetical protein